MEPGDDVRQRVLTAEQQLLEEGMPSYLDAMMALREFRRTVLERCRKVLLTHCTPLADAMGLPLSQDAIQDYMAPNGMGDWDGTWAWLAVRIRLQNVGTVYCGLYMGRKEEHGLSIWASTMLELDTRALFEKVWRMIKTQAPACRNDYGWEIALSQPVPHTHIHAFEDILSSVMHAWCTMWQHLGGLPSLTGGLPT